MARKNRFRSQLLAILLTSGVSAADVAAQTSEEEAPDYGALPKGAVLRVDVLNYQVKTIDSAVETITLSTKQIGGDTKTLSSEVRSLATDLSNLANSSEGIRIDESAAELKISLAGDVLFDFDKDTIRSDAEDSLAKLADILSIHAEHKIRIVGYTDSKGSDTYNRGLSERRARSVAAWLKNRGGLSGWTFNTSGMGENNPAAPNTLANGKDSPEGRQKNRRVEITVKKV